MSLARFRSDVEADVADIKSRHGRILTYVAPNLLAVLLYRVGRESRHLPFGRYAARALCYLGQVLTGAEIDPRAELGPGLYIAHTTGVVIGQHVVAGAHLALFGQVVIGARPDRADNAYPIIGDRVTLYAKASILGGVTLGDDVTVGAHSLVLNDLDSGVTAAGSPARVVHAGGRA